MPYLSSGTTMRQVSYRYSIRRACIRRSCACCNDTSGVRERTVGRCSWSNFFCLHSDALSTSGSRSWCDRLTCSRPQFSRSLGHRLLFLRLPFEFDYFSSDIFCEFLENIFESLCLWLQARRWAEYFAGLGDWRADLGGCPQYASRSTNSFVLSETGFHRTLDRQSRRFLKTYFSYLVASPLFNLCFTDR
jgi:hypothetical protein